MTRLKAPSWATLVILSVLPANAVWAQTDQPAIARRILGQDVIERGRALEAARSIGAANTGPGLRAALITALEREGRISLQRYEADRRGEALAPLEDPEFTAKLARVVAELRDPRSIPALTGALGTGSPPSLALAAFGEQAAPSVLAVVTARESWYELVNGGLQVLRFMVEGKQTRPLTAGTLNRIRLAAEQRLTDRPRFVTTLWRAIDLAVALDDPSLRQIVQNLASDPNESVARGVTDPKLIEQTRKRAAARLAGVQALPRPVIKGAG
jgi:hypothetical protein